MKNSLSPANLVARSAAFTRALVSSLSPLTGVGNGCRERMVGD